MFFNERCVKFTCNLYLFMENSFDFFILKNLRYWNVELWKNLFSKLLNMSPGRDKKVLQELRKSFQDYMISNTEHIKKLKELLARQKASLCSA